MSKTSTSSLAISFTDLHIHNYKNYDINGSRLENCLRVLDTIFAYAHKVGINVILFSGDLYDRQQNLPTIVVNKTVERLHHLFNKYPEMVFIAISGNHDQASKHLIERPADTALTHLAVIFTNNFLLIDDNYVDIHIEDTANVRVAGIPYYEIPEQYLARLVDMTERCIDPDIIDKNILLNHQTPKGITNEGIPYDTDPADPLYGLYDLILCGHIHGKQDLNEDFMLVGSPIHRDLADVGLEKGFWVIDMINTEERKFISLNSKFPTFKKVREDMLEGETNDENDFVVVVPVVDTIKTTTENVSVEQFNTSLSERELVTNFWEEADGKNKALLSMGLSFIQ